MVTNRIGVIRAGQVEFDPPLNLPEGSQVRVILSPVLDERAARGKANLWLAQHVGDAVGAMNGTLSQTEQQTIWRFEAFITGVKIKPRGPIGQVEVDAETGQVLTPPHTAEVMLARGRQLIPAS